MRNILFCLASIVSVTLGQSSSGNIYGYDYDSNALANGPFLVQNPNYQFLNNALASEYAKTYQEEQQQADAAYYASSGSSGSAASGSSGASTSGTSSSSSSSTSNNGQIPVSTSYVPANGYYYGSVLTNAQQNAINYQQITQANPSSSSSSSTGSGSSNIYGYNYGSSSGLANTYNNQQMYSASSSSSGSTATPYIYPFGQYSSSSSSSSNSQVLRDSSNTGSSGTSGTSGSVPSDVGLSYSLFYNDQTATPAYQSQSDLKTTTLRDQALPANVRLQGAGPMPGPTLGSSSTLTQQFNDAGSNAYYYGNANSNTNTGSARVKFSSYPSYTRFFDVAGNQTEMYYPYRTSTNYNVQSNSATSGSSGSSSGVTGASGSTTFYDSLPTSTSNADKCRLSDPYWCADYVNIFTSSKRTYSSDSAQTICTELIASLAESYNGCCTAVRGAGCSM